MTTYCKQCDPPQRFPNRSKYMAHRRDAHPHTQGAGTPKVVPLAAPPTGVTVTHKRILEMALVGFEAEQSRIAALIADIRGQLSPQTQELTPTGLPKRHMTPEGAARIAAAQRKRWAAQKAIEASKAEVAAPAPVKKKRRLSVAGRKAIADATRKRWAAVRKAKAAAAA